jgi:hypothetical protein
MRREHEERLLELVGGLRDRDRAFAHRLEQRGLRLRRGAVDLVGEHDVREDRSALELELLHTALFGDHVRAHDIGGHQVGRELHAREVRVDGLGERAHEHRLAEAGHAFEECVAAAEEAHENAFDDRFLADDHGADLFAESAEVLREDGDGSFDVVLDGQLSHRIGLSTFTGLHGLGFGVVDVFVGTVSGAPVG